MTGEPTPPEEKRSRIVLPGGRTIDVLLYGAPDASSEASPAEQLPLHVCPVCASTLVYPTGWSEEGDEHWSIERRCPECEWADLGIFSQDQANLFDEHLDRGVEVLVRDLRTLASTNMTEEIERFSAALEADAIHPMDF